MIQWNFNASDYTEKTEFQIIPVGEYRARIASAEETTSQAGNPMIILTLDVSGYNSKIWHNVVFMLDNPKLTNQKLGELFNSFGIQPGNFNTQSWIGKVGAIKVKHDTYNGETRPKVAYFISKDRQATLPAWQEGSLTGGAVASNDMPFEDIDVPFE